MDARAETPAAANDLLKALKSVFKFAVARELATVNPVIDIKKIKYKTEGFHTWTVEEVRKFEAHWPVGSTPRLDWYSCSTLACAAQMSCCSVGSTSRAASST